MRASLSRISIALILLAGVFVSACTAFGTGPGSGEIDPFAVPTPTSQPTEQPVISAASRNYFVPLYYYENYIRFIDDSRPETEVIIYATFSEQDLDYLIQAFNEHYPWITVRVEQLDAYEVFNRFYAEAKENQPTADILISPATDLWQTFRVTGQLDGYRTQEEFFIPVWTKLSPGVYGVAVDPLVIVYNKNLVESPPASMKSLVEMTIGKETDFTRQIAVLDANLSSTGYYGTWFWLDRLGDTGWDYLRQIGRTAPRQAATPQELLTLVNEGTASLGYFVPLSAIADTRAEYPNIGWTYISDGQPIQMYMAGITNAGSHSNAARLMMDYLLSQEGQLALSMNGFTPHRNDISSTRFFNQPGTLRLHFSNIENAVGTRNLIYYYFDDTLTSPGKRDEFLLTWSVVTGR